MLARAGGVAAAADLEARPCVSWVSFSPRKKMKRRKVVLFVSKKGRLVVTISFIATNVFFFKEGQTQNLPKLWIQATPCCSV